MRALTDRQEKIMARIGRARAKGELTEVISPDVARQLSRRGLIEILRPWTRYEWNRPVATLSVVMLTEAGKNYLGI